MSSSEPSRLFLPALTLSYRQNLSMHTGSSAEKAANLGECLHYLVRVFQTSDPVLKALEHLLLDTRPSIGIPGVVESLQNLHTHQCILSLIPLSVCYNTNLINHSISIVVVKPGLE